MGKRRNKNKKKYNETRMDYDKLLNDLKHKPVLYQRIIGNHEDNVDLSTLDQSTGDNFVKSLCDELRKKEQHSYETFSDDYRKMRTQKRVRILDELLPDLIKPNFTYLDLGCNDGSITNAISAHYKFDPDNVYGVDIPEWNGQVMDCHVRNMFHVNEWNPKLPYPNDTFNLITCFMVLHHNRNIPAIMRELKRVVRPGGYIVINEHDMNNYINKNVIDFQHLKYSCTEMNDFKPTDFIGSYKSKREWDQLFGMKILSSTQPTGVTRSYYTAYIRLL